jgi:hypothetical protein
MSTFQVLPFQQFSVVSHFFVEQLELPLAFYGPRFELTVHPIDPGLYAKSISVGTFFDNCN